MAKVNIVYLMHHRSFYDMLLDILSKCHYRDYELIICTHKRYTEKANRVLELAREKDVPSSLMMTKSMPDYMEKVRRAAELPSEYSIKLDDDVMIGPQVFDFWFNNLDRILNNPENLILSPALSSGIPTCDSFIDNNLTPQDKKQLYEQFSGYKFPPQLFRFDYRRLNPVLQSGYDPKKFYSAVSRINYHFLGVHPIRSDPASIRMLNDMVSRRLDLFFEMRDFRIQANTAPYLCNSCYAIKTAIWKKILNDRRLFVDWFDEVPLNRYRHNTRTKMQFITNSFGIHPVYNTVSRSAPAKSEARQLVEKLRGKLSEGLRSYK